MKFKFCYTNVSYYNYNIRNVFNNLHDLVQRVRIYFYIFIFQNKNTITITK